jgi:hypothetical protein
VGAIAEAIVTYAQPLFDATDGSESEIDHALAIAQMCWNFALLPAGERETAIIDFRLSAV